MIYKLSIKSVTSTKRYSKNSARLLFIRSNDGLKKYLKNSGIELSKPQLDKFNEDENSEVQIWNSKSPELQIIKKVDLDKKFNNDYFRNYLSGLVQSFEKTKIENLFIDEIDFSEFKTFFKSVDYFYQTIIEGIHLGNYNFSKYQTKSKKQKSLKVFILSNNHLIVNKAIKFGESVSKAVYFSRDLVNEPANVLTPHEFAVRVKNEFKGTNVKVQLLDEKELTKRKMNAILSVGKGSINKPKLIIAHYKPKVKSTRKICLVGKGVTYDTGGLSIKPTAGMLEMKADMAGGATVFGILKAAESISLPIELIGIVPAVENAISGNSYKPGDIISTASGKTIEVKDTDAEGRIVLADALEYASKLKPDEIIDFATLTGAVAVALGLFTAGVFTKSNEMAERIMNASEETYEHTWRLPFWDEFNNLLESKIADVSNLGPRWGGAISAGKFLEHFVDEKIPWTHIDLAGPALKHDLTNYTKNYCTGFGVRLISEYLRNYK